jgi:hypothetical protein
MSTVQFYKQNIPVKNDLCYRTAVVSIISPTEFTCTLNLGDSEFIGYFAYVQRDIGGLGAPPQGEKQPVVGYTGITGDIVIANAYTAPLQVGDEILLLHPILLASSSSVAGSGLVVYMGITVAPGDTLVINNPALVIGDITLGASSGIAINADCTVIGNINLAATTSFMANSLTCSGNFNAGFDNITIVVLRDCYIPVGVLTLGVDVGTGAIMIVGGKLECNQPLAATHIVHAKAWLFVCADCRIGYSLTNSGLILVIGTLEVEMTLTQVGTAMLGAHNCMCGELANDTGLFGVYGDLMCKQQVTNSSGTVDISGSCQVGTNGITSITGPITVGGGCTTPSVTCNGAAIITFYGACEIGGVYNNSTGHIYISNNSIQCEILNASTGIITIYGDCQIDDLQNVGGGNITISGVAKVAGTFTNTHISLFTSNGLICSSNFVADSDGVNIVVNGDCKIAGSFSLGGGISGSCTILGTFSAGSITNAIGATLIAGSTVIRGSYDEAGTATFNGDLTVIGALTNAVTGIITVKAIGYLYGAIANTGTLTYNLPASGGGGLGEIHMGITVAAAGTTTINNDVLCIGDVIVGAGATLTINGNLHVTGDFTADDGTMIMIYGNCFIAGNISGLIVGNGTDGTMVVLGKLEIGSNPGTGIVINTGAGLFTGDCKISGGSATLTTNSQLGTANLEIARILSANVDGVVITVAGDCKVADTFRLGNGTSGDCTITGTLSAGSLSTAIGATLVVGGDTTVQGNHGEEGAPIFNGDLRVIGTFQIMGSASVIINGNLDAVGGIILSTGSLTCNNIFAGAAGIEITASSGLASADCICEGTFIANVDGVTITIGGNCLIYDNFSLGGGTSGACLVAGNFKAIGATIAAGASCVIGGHAEPGGISGLGTFTYIYGVQPEDSVDFPADNIGEDVLNLGGGVGIHYKVKSLWLNFTDPVAAHYTIELSQLINGSLMVVKTTTVNTPGGFYNLMDLFGVPELSGDSIEIRATLSVAGPLAVTGSSVYEVE